MVIKVVYILSGNDDSVAINSVNVKLVYSELYTCDDLVAEDSASATVDN